MSEFEKVNCNICGGIDSEFISDKGDFGLPVNLVLCKKCGLGYLSPRWKKDRYIQFYCKEYDKYYRPRLLSNKTNISVNKNSNAILGRLKKYLGEITKANVLDIGSGEGNNLFVLKGVQPDSNYYAIEPSESSQKILKHKNIKLVASDVDVDWEKGYENYFDIIIMRHVLEHFLDPTSVLEKVRTTLKDNGILYIAVPDNLKRKRNKGWLRVPHTYYFNKYSLTNILLKAGFSVSTMVEGDQYNNSEIYCVSKKSTDKTEPILLEEHYLIQKDVFKHVLK